MIITATIFFFTILFIDLTIDYRRWKRERYFYHRKKWWRGIALLPSVILLSGSLSGSLLFTLPYCWALVGFTYWTLFDGIFNIVRRLPWNYVGVPDIYDAGLDKVQREYKWLWLAKIIISAGLIIVYLKFI